MLHLKSSERIVYHGAFKVCLCIVSPMPEWCQPCSCFSPPLTVPLSVSPKKQSDLEFLFLDANPHVGPPNPFGTKRCSHIEAHKASVDDTLSSTTQVVVVWAAGQVERGSRTDITNAEDANRKHSALIPAYCVHSEALVMQKRHRWGQQSEGEGLCSFCNTDVSMRPWQQIV